ncbi:MAG: MFS transporter [Candidatus Moranbacteria bacterium]|nr:MFS transporter [Candidatus Moranbacteria bacterium]
MKQTHKESFNKNIIKYLYFCTFLLGIASAFILYLESDYFKVALRSENISPFFIVSYGLALVLMLNWHHLVRTFGKRRVFQFSLGVKLALCFFLMLLPASFWTVWLLVFYIAFTVLSWLDMDILLETCSVDKKTGKIRGLYLTIENTGYLVAPFFSGLLISRFGFQSAFAVSFAILLTVFLIVSTRVGNVDHCPIKKTQFVPMLKRIFARKNIMKAYYVSFLLEFFYALMIIYTPLYLLDLGFDWFQIGKIFTVMLVPFVLFQYPAGYMADKKYEERDMMAVALLVMGFSTLALYFIGSKSAIVWAAMLFCTRIGASVIEILRDSYFYKRIDQRDVDITDFFRTVRPMAYIIGALIAAPIVFVFHIKLIFIIIGIAVLTGIPVSLSLASNRIPPKTAAK